MYVGLKEYLEKKGYSQQLIASELGVSVPYVNAILVGSKTLGKKGAKKWANLFGLSEKFLLTGKGSPDPLKDEELHKQIFYDTIQKANRFVAVLNYLVDEGYISNHMAIAPILQVTESVVMKAKNYDPEGKYDFIFVKLTHEYPFLSLEWMLIGEGEMTNDVSHDEYQENIDAKILQLEDKIVKLEAEVSNKNMQIDNINRELSSVNRESSTKDLTIQTQLELIEQYKIRINSLELENNRLKSQEIINNYNFPIGVAEDRKSEDSVSV